MTFEGMFDQAKLVLLPHLGHTIEVVDYGTDWARDDREVVNFSVECVDCHEVLIDFPSHDCVYSLDKTEGPESNEHYDRIHGKEKES